VSRRWSLSPGCLAGLLAIVSYVPGLPAVAGESGSVLPSEPAYRGSAREIRLTPPRTEHPPRIDGALDDPEWQHAAVLDSFVMSYPIEEQPDTLGTRAFVMYDRHYLYVGVRCLDVATVDAPLTARDHADEGDYIGVGIDTYFDRRRSMVFCANARGVQSDGTDADDNGYDAAPDFQYQSRGRLIAGGRGYEVEMAIPFRSLRFTPRDTLSFGFNIARAVHRSDASYFFAPLTDNIPSRHSQFGVLENLSGVRPGRDIQINPSYTSLSTASRDADGLAYGATEDRLGVGLKVGLTSGLIADATVNPDFSQVEADAAVVDINQRFAIFFPEKRPFFLEGSDIFKSPLQVVYTRRIADPAYGVKLTGKAGRTSIGVLNAMDRSAGDPVPTLPNAANPYYGTDAAYTIARFKQDVLGEDYVGVLSGVREQGDSYNRGLGFDGRAILFKHTTLTGQLMGSSDRERDYRASIASLPPAEAATVDSSLLEQDGATHTGYAYNASLRRDTRLLRTGLFAEDFSQHFSADMGFIPRTNIVTWGFDLTPVVYGSERSRFSTIEPTLLVSQVWEHGDDRYLGQRLDETLRLGLEWNFHSNADIAIEASRQFIRNEGVAFDDLIRGGASFSVNQFRRIRGALAVSAGDDVLFEENVRGRSVSGSGDLTLRGGGFQAVGTLAGSVLWRDADDTRYADVVIPRLKLEQQFTREWSLRGIAELRSERTYDGAGQVALSTRELALDLLITYLLRPGSVAYLGYGTGLEGQTLDIAEPQRAGVFVKLSWLWQL
jgi:hypothetical protein